MQRSRSIYVSNSTHEKLTRIATILGMGKTTVSSYVESIIQHHFDKHKDEINELYKKKNGKPIMILKLIIILALLYYLLLLLWFRKDQKDVKPINKIIPKKVRYIIKKSTSLLVFH